ncbi:MAG: Cof-type HAD-IIB family hydrolase [Dehalococcoidales bacterium]
MAEKSYKLLVADIDGTLLNKHGVISDEDTRALARVGELGIPVSLSTGRVVQSSLRLLDSLSLDGYHIFFDGALVYNPKTKQEIYASQIKKELLGQIVDFTHGLGLDIDLYSIADYFVARETWVTDIRRDFYDLHPVIVELEKILLEEKIIKGAIVVSSSEEKAKAEEIRRQFADRLNFSWTGTPAYPDMDFINIIASGVSKGKALEALASFLEIPLAEVMAIGDGANDISLLSTAGLAIAVGNASDDLKAVADYVTLDVDHNGVAAAINRFLL